MITDYGKGFDKSNLSRMRKFYSLFNNVDALRQELSWTHYRLILKVDDEKKRNFYIDECIKSNWSTRQLEFLLTKIPKHMEDTNRNGFKI